MQFLEDAEQTVVLFSLQKCYIHKYKTESGSTLYDLGCITSQVQQLVHFIVI